MRGTEGRKKERVRDGRMRWRGDRKNDRDGRMRGTDAIGRIRGREGRKKERKRGTEDWQGERDGRNRG
jgi:hypothetical protein